MDIRPEIAADHAAVRALHQAAFDSPGEAGLVDALRQRARSVISLVAVDGGVVVGHILFSPVTLGDADGADGTDEEAGLLLGLAPMAVTPERQGRGIGSALVEAGLEAARAAGARGCVVLGHPEYYPRFGFVPASRFGLGSSYDVPDEVFMAMELIPRAFDDLSGTVRYHPAFAEL